MKNSILILIIFYTAISINSCSDDIQNQFQNKQNLITQKTEIFITPFLKGEDLTSGLSLVNSYIDMDDLVSDLLQKNSIDSNIEVKSRSNSLFLNNQTSKSKEYAFYINGIKLCDYFLKAHTSNNTFPLVLGDLPPSEINNEMNFDSWPDYEIAYDTAFSTAFLELNLNDPPTIIGQKQCLKVVNKKLEPAWDFVLKVNKLYYHAIANEHQTFLFERRYFGATGTARIYDKNKVDGTLSDFKLEGLVEDGTLENNYFVTEIDSSSNASRATASDYNFQFNPDTEKSQFEETSLFTNANRMLEWLKNYGYTDDNFGDNKIKVVAHAVFNGDSNNALYQPEVNGGATFFIGDGDGQVLANLATDADVISHEFGHHVVYRSIKKTTGESLVVHEGLADFLAYIRNGDSCLGESICPSNSPISCAVRNKCLRTASNDLTYGSASLPTDAHNRSQFISGMLWDLREKDSIPSEDLTKIVLKSIDYFVLNSGYKHLVIGLIHADREIFSGKYCSKIYSRAWERGLSSYIESFGCGDSASGDSSTIPSLDNALPGQITESDASIQGEEQTLTQKSKGSSGGLCGSIGIYNGSSKNMAMICFLLLLPLLALLTPKRKKEPSK